MTIQHLGLKITQEKTSDKLSFVTTFSLVRKKYCTFEINLSLLMKGYSNITIRR